MASISSYATASGKRWRVRYRTPDRQQTDRRGFRTKRDAELFAASTEVSIARGEYVDSAGARQTIGEVGTVWRASRGHLKPSTARVEDGTWRTWVLPRWEHVRLADVRHTDVQTWVASIPRSATVARQSHALLSSILDAAVRDRLIPANPAQGVRLPRKVGKARHYLTHEQVEALAEASRDRGTLVRFLAYTGLRWGEATGMRVRDLDADRGRVTVQQNAVAVGGEIIVGTPKTHRSRAVPVPAFLLDELVASAADKGPNAYLFGRGLSPLRSPDVRDGWFAGAKRKTAAEDASFPAALTLHDLRHTAASLAISAGANVKAVQRMLGHASAAMTLDTYADLFDDDLDAVATALDQARAASVVGKMWADSPIEVPRSA